jgi:hypothetical protein
MGGEGGGGVINGGSRGKGGEMTQTLYVHMNEKKKASRPFSQLYILVDMIQNSLWDV